MEKLLKISKTDNVAVALSDLQLNEAIVFENETITIKSFVKAKHKIALTDLPKGESITMYGVLIGRAKEFIKKGEVLTIQNVKHESSPVTHKTESFFWSPPPMEKWKNATFLGYHRTDGQVGTENVWLFFPLVFCENHNIELLKDIFEKELLNNKENSYRLFLRNLISNSEEQIKEESFQTKNILKNIQVRFLTHQAGCGSTRQDAEALANLLAGYVHNPNVAGVSVLSLGCQNLQVELFQKALNKINPNLEKPILIFEHQKIGSTDEMLKQIIEKSYQAILNANKMERQPAPLSKLTIGLECGGSDGFSGISANPLLGVVSDIVVALGGKVILSEFPELCGVEQEIVNRCISDENAEKFLKLMKNYEKSVVAAGSGFDMNPSPGNIKDGLITDAMKSAGAAKKGGTSPVVSVLDYGEYATENGLTLLCTPGNDVESTTAMAGSGANLILFTTGLGTPTGNPVVPVIKVASNSELAQKMADIIDFDAGKIIKGTKSMQEMADELLNEIIEIASGKKQTKAQLKNQNDFIHWRRSVSL